MLVSSPRNCFACKFLQSWKYLITVFCFNVATQGDTIPFLFIGTSTMIQSLCLDPEDLAETNLPPFLQGEKKTYQYSCQVATECLKEQLIAVGKNLFHIYLYKPFNLTYAGSCCAIWHFDGRKNFKKLKTKHGLAQSK